MIFYFSGTGNSLYVAQKLHESDKSELIDIAQALQEKRFQYEVKGAEKIGFVFPVYFYGLPSLVVDFVEQFTLKGSQPFIYSVITCGGSIGNADKMLGNMLKEKGLLLNSSFSVKMPSNYTMMYEAPNPAKQENMLQAAQEEIAKIRQYLEVRKEGDFAFHGYLGLLSGLAYHTYGMMRKTGKFYATADCNNCGLCEKLCPSQVIHIQDGKPEWIRKKCSHCAGCINRCPEQAIQYGKATIKRRRYVNPHVEFS